MTYDGSTFHAGLRSGDWNDGAMMDQRTNSCLNAVQRDPCQVNLLVACANQSSMTDTDPVWSTNCIICLLVPTRTRLEDNDTLPLLCIEVLQCITMFLILLHTSSKREGGEFAGLKN
eukprot:1436678-Amphidinium_carterae.1